MRTRHSKRPARDLWPRVRMYRMYGGTQGGRHNMHSGDGAGWRSVRVGADSHHRPPPKWSTFIIGTVVTATGAYGTYMREARGRLQDVRRLAGHAATTTPGPAHAAKP